MLKTAFAVLALAAPALAAQEAGWTRIEGLHTQVSAPMTASVMDQKAWETLWSLHQPGVPVPPVDFTRE